MKIAQNAFSFKQSIQTNMMSKITYTVHLLIFNEFKGINVIDVLETLRIRKVVQNSQVVQNSLS